VVVYIKSLEREGREGGGQCYSFSQPTNFVLFFKKPKILWLRVTMCKPGANNYVFKSRVVKITKLKNEMRGKSLLGLELGVETQPHKNKGILV
jgi:hypothetical protein